MSIQELVHSGLSQSEAAKRNDLASRKPYVAAKLKRVSEMEERGEISPIIRLEKSYLCNFQCTHCSAEYYMDRHLEKVFKIKDERRKIDLDDVASKGYTFQIDMTRRVIEAGGTVAEVPIYFPDREHGLSKMSGSIITEALISTGRWGIEHRTQQLKNVGHKLADEFESFNSRDH